MLCSDDTTDKVAIKYEVVKNRWFWGPRFSGEGIAQISGIHFQIALISEHVAGFGRVPFSKLRG